MFVDEAVLGPARLEVHVLAVRWPVCGPRNHRGLGSRLGVLQPWCSLRIPHVPEPVTSCGATVRFAAQIVLKFCGFRIFLFEFSYNKFAVNFLPHVCYNDENNQHIYRVARGGALTPAAILLPMLYRMQAWGRACLLSMMP